MSKFTSRSSKPSPQPSITPLPSNSKEYEMNKWQRAYSVHLDQMPTMDAGEERSRKWNRRSSSLVGNGVALATLTTHVVKYHKLSGELRGMLFNSKKVTSGWGYSIVILLTNIVYILLGTYVFMVIEGPAEEKEQRDDWIKQEHLLEHISGSEVMLPKLLELQKDMCMKSNSKTTEDKTWEFLGSLHYCLTVISTIGYGVAIPHNHISKATTLVYAMFGIPIYAVYLSYAYLAISTLLDRLTDLVFLCLRRTSTDLRKVGTKLLLGNVILWSYLMILIFLWTPIEEAQQKSFVDELYWQVIRFTSVGFGDEIRDVSNQPAHIPGILNVFTVSFIILPFGISLVSFFFQMYRKLSGGGRKWAERRCRKIKRTAYTKLKTTTIGRDSNFERPNSTQETCADLAPIAEVARDSPS